MVDQSKNPFNIFYLYLVHKIYVRIGVLSRNNVVCESKSKAKKQLPGGDCVWNVRNNLSVSFA